MNDTKYWAGGLLWGGVQTSSSNAPGTTKYWSDGLMYGDIFSTPETPAVSSFMIWFS